MEVDEFVISQSMPMQRERERESGIEKKSDPMMNPETRPKETPRNNPKTDQTHTPRK
jgi:hypothetical protein